jgi:transposase
MSANNLKLDSDQTVFVGIDLHRKTWHVTITTQDIELFCGRIQATWDALRLLLDRYKAHPIQAVYEAGYFGYWLHDRLVEYGADCIVTPPSLIPQQVGNPVKTDPRDSRKLAHYLAKGMLKRVWVPSLQEPEQRNVVRRRRQLIADRVRTRNRIKAELRFYGIELPEPQGPWRKAYLENLHRVRFSTRWMRESFKRLLEQYELLSKLIEQQTKLLKELAATDSYRDRVKILCSIPGVGIIAAMEMLLELQDVARFGRADQLAAYVGLTPSQYASADKVRMGHITGIGKNSLRATLVEASWRLIAKDNFMREKYERIKVRAGAKRAIVAVARNLLLCSRRMLLNAEEYQADRAA